MSISHETPDFAPDLAGYTGQGAFRFWCQKVLPIVYDDSLSYYELLNKVVNYLNNVIKDVATVEENVGSLYSAYGDLQDYVDRHIAEIEEIVNTFTSYIYEYFENLDVQVEINAKLDEMARSGELTAIVAPAVEPLIPHYVSDWLEDNITPTTPAIDSSLTVEGAGADSKTVGDALSDIIAKDYDPTNGIYSIGDYCLQLNKLYRCIYNIDAPEMWTAAHWELVNVGAEVNNLNRAVGDTLAGLIPFSYYTVRPGNIFSGGLWTGVTGTAYKHVAIPVQSGDSIKVLANNTIDTVLGFVKTYSIPVANSEPLDFSSATGYNARINITSSNSGSYIVPSDTTYLIVGTMWSGTNSVPASLVINGNDLMVSLLERLNQTDSKIGVVEQTTADTAIQVSKKIDAGYSHIEQAPAEINAGKLWNGTAFVDNAACHCDKYAVTAGDNVTVTGLQVSPNYMLYRVYNSGGVELANSAGLDVGTTNSTFVVPTGASYLLTNCYNSRESKVTVNVLHTDIDYYATPQVKCTVFDSGIIAETASGFKFDIRKIGNNNLINLFRGYFKENALFTTTTDWIGPYNFTKDSDYHGDQESGTTGGNHPITNGLSPSDPNYQSAPTAETVEWKVLCNGIEETIGDYYCEDCVLIWTNRVMAGNTAKLDGNGEYCLTETITLRIKGDGSIDVNVKFTPTSNCTMHWYSGLQFAGRSFAENVYIPEYTTEYISSSEIAGVATNAVVGRYFVEGDDYGVEMWLDRCYGFPTNPVDDSITGNTTKTYFTQVNYSSTPVPILAGHTYVWRGGYKFYCV